MPPTSCLLLDHNNYSVLSTCITKEMEEEEEKDNMEKEKTCLTLMGGWDGACRHDLPV